MSEYPKNEVEKAGYLWAVTKAVYFSIRDLPSTAFEAGAKYQEDRILKLLRSTARLDAYDFLKEELQK